MKKDLVDFAEDFICAEEKYGVNAVFLAALAAFESGWGSHCFLKNNMFGWGGKSFETKSEGIDFVASKLAEHYLSEDGKYYHGMNLYGVNRSYNGSQTWVDNLMAMMSKISESARIYHYSGSIVETTEEGYVEEPERNVEEFYAEETCLGKNDEVIVIGSN